MTSAAPRPVYFWADADILDVLRRRSLGHGIAQIAVVFGVSDASIKGVLHRARHFNQAGSRMEGLLVEHARRMAADGGGK